MSIHFAIYPVARLVRYTVAGTATAVQAREFLAAVLDHRHYKRGFDFLGEPDDFALGSNTPFTAIFAREVVALARHLRPCKWAVVAPSEAAIGVTRAASALARECGVEIAAFPTAAEATDWLGPAPTERPALSCASGSGTV